MATADEAGPRRTGDGFDTLFSLRYGQTYHSMHGAGVEAQHVFLDATGTAERLGAGEPTRVLEVGFGTGLNFLLTAKQAITTDTPLTFVALERDVLPASTLATLNHREYLGRAPAASLIAWRRTLSDGVQEGEYEAQFGPVKLVLLIGDATEVALPGGFDAVYLDAFSPDANPELWTALFLHRLHEALRPGGRLATYSAKGSVRRALAEAGFVVEKRAGPPGKREITVATRLE